MITAPRSVPSVVSIPARREAPIARSLPTAKLSVQRKDLHFGKRKNGLVWLEIEVHNHGQIASEAQYMHVEHAPFGAFVAGTPVIRILVPPIPPKSSVRVGAEFFDEDGSLRAKARADQDPSTSPLGGLLRARILVPPIPPKSSVRVGADFFDEDGSLRRWARADQEPSTSPLRGLLRAMTRAGAAARALLGAPTKREPVWAGNFNIHLGGQAAERHCATIKLQPGATNEALFFVGDRPDQYTFDFLGDGVAWNPTLAFIPDGRGIIEPKKLTRINCLSIVYLSITPPANVRKGTLTVSVTQLSSGKKALVEFGFGVDTIQPQCFAR